MNKELQTNLLENNMETQELKERIQKLISYSDKLGERSKNLNKLLYQQLSEVIELETLEKLEGKYLMAYLMWKSIKRANYQPKLVNLTNYKEDGKEKLLEAIEKEVELIEINNQKEISKELTNEELLRQLGLRIKTGEIKSDWKERDYEKRGCNCVGCEILYIEDLEHPENTEEYIKKSMLLILKDGDIVDFKGEKAEEIKEKD